jgi:hypothetical protein
MTRLQAWVASIKAEIKDLKTGREMMKKLRFHESGLINIPKWLEWSIQPSGVIFFDLADDSCSCYVGE